MHTCNDPDFSNLLAVLRREAPARPTLFEFFLNGPLYQKLAGIDPASVFLGLDGDRMVMNAFCRAGYDYVSVIACGFGFPVTAFNQLATRSMDDTAIILDRATYEAYPWPDPDSCDYSRLDVLARDLAEGMKFIAFGPGGVLENVVKLVGYQGLCLMTMDDPELVDKIFEGVGSRLVRYYELCAPHPAVGAVISNDDWGFNAQTMLRPEDMRRYVFPWHERIVEVIHAAGKPAILHSCGNLEPVMDDIIDGMCYDAKHSYEDKICPVEESYERWGKRIAILGGIDVDFLCRSPLQEISARAQAMLDRSALRGGFALGSGNSIPYFVPDDSYFAMIEPAVAGRR
jgi:uroporphyrinogen decarboxylase